MSERRLSAEEIAWREKHWTGADAIREAVLVACEGFPGMLDGVVVTVETAPGVSGAACRFELDGEPWARGSCCACRAMSRTAASTGSWATCPPLPISRESTSEPMSEPLEKAYSAHGCRGVVWRATHGGWGFTMYVPWLHCIVSLGAELPSMEAAQETASTVTGALAGKVER